MKNKFLNIFAISALTAGAFLMTSCNEDETLVRKGKPGMTISQNGTSTTITEGEDIVITFNLEYALKDATQVRVEFNGDGVTYSDFNGTTMDSAGGGFYGGEGFYISIPAFTDTYTYNLGTVQDVFPESDETATLTFYSAAKGYATIDQEMTVTMNNYVQPNDDVSIRLEWDDAASTNGEFAGCDIDYDLEVYDGGFGLFADSYYDCPELIVIADTAPDGNYFVVPSLYDLGGTPDTAADAVNLPFKLVIYKAGIWYNEMDFNDPAFNSFDGVGAATLGAVLVKTGTSFELQDGNGDTISTGKMGLPQFTSSRK